MTQALRTPRPRLRRLSVAAFALGACSVAVYFLTIPREGPAHPWVLWTLIVIPFVCGVAGAVCGALSRSLLATVMNLVLVFAFPLVMFGGALLEAGGAAALTALRSE